MEKIPKQVYTKAFREQAAKLVLQDGMSVPEAARRLSMSAKTLANWVHFARSGKLVEMGEKRKPVTDLEAENSRLRRELAEAKMERDLLKKATAYFARESLQGHAFIKTMRPHYPLPLMCRVFDVSQSGYHAWSKRPLSKRALDNARLEVAIQVAHQRTRQTYSAERLQPELAADGFDAGVGRIKRLRKKLGLRCKQKRKFKATTNSNHRLPVAPNLLGQQFSATRPNEVWVTDITYVATGEGWIYLAGIKDIYTCEIVGYAIDARMTKDLVGRALFQAVTAKRPMQGLIHHSDRGSQYCSYEYQRLVQQFGMKASMSRRGNCYDNAPMESFWGTLKNELVHHRCYETRQQAISEITEYIEIFYNRQRRHSRLGYVAPAVFAKQFYQQHKAA